MGALRSKFAASVLGLMGNNVAGKVVVITGASSGLGEATARHQFHEQFAIPADSFARAVAFAMSQPDCSTRSRRGARRTDPAWCTAGTTQVRKR